MPKPDVLQETGIDASDGRLLFGPTEPGPDALWSFYWKPNDGHARRVGPDLLDEAMARERLAILQANRDSAELLIRIGRTADRRPVNVFHGEGYDPETDPEQPY